MKIRNMSKEEIEQALEETNKKFNDNIIFKKLIEGKTFTVTLKVKDSRQKGSRIGSKGQRMCAACWHAHNAFIKNIFKIKPDAIVISLKHKIDKKTYDADDFDINMGNTSDPTRLSKMCNCKNFK